MIFQAKTGENSPKNVFINKTSKMMNLSLCFQQEKEKKK